MSKNITSLVVGIILIAGIGFTVYSQKNASLSLPDAPQDTQPTPSTTPTDTAATPSVTASPSSVPTTSPTPTKSSVISYTAAQVAEHSSRASCWSTINGNVYDLTSWIPKHPGGEQAILQICGTDGSAKFNGKHGGAAKQAAILAGFKIGVAAQ